MPFYGATTKNKRNKFCKLNSRVWCISADKSGCIYICKLWFISHVFELLRFKIVTSFHALEIDQFSHFLDTLWQWINTSTRRKLLWIKNIVINNYSKTREGKPQAAYMEIIPGIFTVLFINTTSGMDEKNPMSKKKKKPLFHGLRLRITRLL